MFAYLIDEILKVKNEEETINQGQINIGHYCSSTDMVPGDASHLIRLQYGNVRGEPPGPTIPGGENENHRTVFHLLFHQPKPSQSFPLHPPK